MKCIKCNKQIPKKKIGWIDCFAYCNYCYERKKYIELIKRKENERNKRKN